MCDREVQKPGSGPPEMPEFPMYFTKRATSIVPTGAEIYHHSTITQTVDYEGELGIIIGKGGSGIKKKDAWKHVWGATIINDVKSIVIFLMLRDYLDILTLECPTRYLLAIVSETTNSSTSASPSTHSALWALSLFMVCQSFTSSRYSPLVLEYPPPCSFKA